MAFIFAFLKGSGMWMSILPGLLVMLNNDIDHWN